MKDLHSLKQILYRKKKILLTLAWSEYPHLTHRDLFIYFNNLIAYNLHFILVRLT